MPNHCYHHFALTSVTDKQLDILNKIIAHPRGMCGYYIPMPEDIANTTSPTKVVSEAEYKKAIRPDANKSIYASTPITKKIQIQLMGKYGTDNWYDWACDKWGTKWGCYDSDIDGDTLTCTTAWSPMRLEIVELFALDFPNFSWHWEEEQGYGMYVDYVDGEQVHCESYDAPQWLSIAEAEQGTITELEQGWDATYCREEAKAGYYWDYELGHPLNEEEINLYINNKN